MILRFTTLFITLVLFGNISIAQIGERFNEDEMTTRKEFLEAHQEKLLGRFDKALPLYEELYKKNRKNPVISYELARVNKELDKADAVEKYIKKAIENDPSNIYYHKFFAEFLTDEQRYLEAAQSFDKLVMLKPNNQSYYKDLATSYLSHGSFDQALSTLDRLESKIGISEEISRKKFDLNATLDRKEAAVKELEKLIKAYPGNLRYKNNLASYFNKNGEEKKAQKIYEQILQLDPDDAMANLALRETTKAKSKSSSNSGLSSLQPIIANDKISIDQKIKELIPPVMSATQNDVTGTNSKLEGLLNDLTNAHPTEAKAYAIHGDYYMNISNHEQAITKYQKTIELNKGIYPVWTQLMYALDATENYSELEKVSMDAIEYYPNQAETYYFNGKSILNNNGKLEKAIDNLQEASLIAGKKLDLKHRIYTYLAQAYLQSKDSKRAQKYVDKALEINKEGNPVLDQIISDIDKL